MRAAEQHERRRGTAETNPPPPPAQSENPRLKIESGKPPSERGLVAGKGRPVPGDGGICRDGRQMAPVAAGLSAAPGPGGRRGRPGSQCPGGGGRHGSVRAMLPAGAGGRLSRGERGGPG